MYYSLCEVKRILLVCVEEKHQQFKCVEVRTIFGQDKSKDQVRSRERTLHLQFLILRPFISVMDYKDPQDVNFLLLLSICLHFSFCWTLFSYTYERFLLSILFSPLGRL